MKCHNCGKPFKLKYSLAGVPHCAHCGATVKGELGKLVGYREDGIPIFSKTRNLIENKIIRYTVFGDPVYAARKSKKRTKQ